jgi:predicted acyl esterase
VAIGGVLVIAGGLALGLVLGTGGPSPSSTQTGAGEGGASVQAPASTSSTTTTTRPSSSTSTTATTTTTQPAPTTTQPPTTTPAPSPATSPTAVTTTTTPPPTGPEPFARLTCKATAGVRFCQGNGKSQRVPSFDAVPLDADVTLPPSGNGPFPLLVLLHGFGASKTAFEASSNDGNLDNITMASHGWAVLTYTARGFGASCGTAASRSGTPACDRGWIHLADQRYEIRDTDYLAGMLVDEGIARPKFAVAGQSYGAGQAVQLAVLKNRMMLTDGKLVSLTSPTRHVAMSVSAVYAQWPWDDLAGALVPNGNVSSTTNTAAAADIDPVGVPKQSWLQLLYSTAADFYVAPPGADPTANLTDWYHELMAGEPYGSSTRSFLRQAQTYKSAIGVPMPSGGPAPTAISAGWTDTLFPVSEAQHYANRWTAAGAQNPLLLMYADVGHGWAQNKPADSQAINNRAIAFLDAEGLHRGSPKAGLYATPTTCPMTAPSGSTLTGSSLSSLATGSLTVSGGASGQVVTSSGGSPSTAAALSPTNQPLCNPLPSGSEPGTATYSQAVGSSPVTLIGAPRVQASISIKGNYPELVARLWDVSPGGTRQIVAMGIYRPSANQEAGTSTSAVATANVDFQLNPADYTFAAGDTVQLELVGSNAPYFRKSNGTFSITVSGLSARLPTR